MFDFILFEYFTFQKDGRKLSLPPAWLRRIFVFSAGRLGWLLERHEAAWQAEHQRIATILRRSERLHEAQILQRRISIEQPCGVGKITQRGAFATGTFQRGL